MRSNDFATGDVFWAPDSFSAGGRPRPWLVLVAEVLPFAGEEYLCAGLTLSDLDANVAIGPEDWVAGNDPSKMSYCSPWVLGTVKDDAVAGPQGALTADFTREIIRQGRRYLAGDMDLGS